MLATPLTPILEVRYDLRRHLALLWRLSVPPAWTVAVREEQGLAVSSQLLLSSPDVFCRWYVWASMGRASRERWLPPEQSLSECWAPPAGLPLAEFASAVLVEAY